MRRFFSNPFMLKELRQLTRSRMVVLSLLLCLGAEVVALWVAPAKGVMNNTGSALFDFLTVLYALAAVLLLPINVFFRTCRERGGPGEPSDLVLATPLSSAQVVDGKILSATAVSLMFATALLPFGVAAYTLHGLVLSAAFGTTAVVFAFSVLSVTFVLTVATLRASRVVRWLAVLVFGLVFFGAMIPASEMLLTADGGIPWIWIFVLLSLAALFRGVAIELLAPERAERSIHLRLTAVVLTVGWSVWAVATYGIRSSEANGTFCWLIGWHLFLFALAMATRFGYSRRQLSERRFWPLATGALNGAVFALAGVFLCAALDAPWFASALSGVRDCADFPCSKPCHDVLFGIRFAAFAAYFTAAVLTCRFLWRQVCRWRALPPSLVPYFGVVLMVVGSAALSCVETYCGFSMTFVRFPKELNVLDEPVSSLVAGCVAFAVAALANLPAALKTLRLRWQPQGESNSSTKHEKLVS